MNIHTDRIAALLNIHAKQVNSTIALLAEGATIPFIARYRKELTGSLDEVQIEQVEHEYKRLIELEKRKASILESIEKQGQLTDALKQKITDTWDIHALEDLYLPFKQKRKTRATIAKELGLEPLASTLFKQQIRDIESLAEKFVTDDVPDVDAALAGARDIMAEWINEHAGVREKLRSLFAREATITTKVVKSKVQEADIYRDYFDFSEPLKFAKSHRVLAILRAENEGFLRLSIEPDTEKALDLAERIFIKANNPCAEQVFLALEDAYKRLLQPSLENEFKKLASEKAQKEATAVFAENVRQLLLQSPLSATRVLAIDPGFRTGCKIVCLDEYGDLKYNETIYPHPPQNEKKQAATKIGNYVESYKIEAIAIGNGTAGRETYDFIKGLHYLPKNLRIFMVNEAGASVYSASKVAREEFPAFDVTVRGAVSIGRRLIDPLAELVKIEPKAIGVGQYQHDIDQKLLSDSLTRVVESCVNAVGVDVNTASKHLLQYVSGIGPKLAENIVEYRSKHGKIDDRAELKKVSGLGPKAYEMCAGFLRINDGDNPLDASAVHPERYDLVKKMAKDVGLKVEHLIRNTENIKQINIHTYVSQDVGTETLQDILVELAKPGRDPRGAAKEVQFDSNIKDISDLKPGMVINGIVTNITNFGAFVSVGAKQDGLVHISQLANRFVSDPNEVVKLNQQVRVKVMEVDVERKRIAFSMKEAE